MIASEVRDLSWQELRGRLAGPRQAAWVAMWRAGRPLTTAEIAEEADLPLLTARPRVSELVAWGFAECTGRRGHEGLYRALPLHESFARWAGAMAERQLELHLTK